MNNEQMGQFIAELRKSKQMTQKDLAATMGITDKAVSKWERGLSSPDVSLLSSIADTLGVTTGELLNGAKSNATSEDTQVIVDNALQYAGKAVKRNGKRIRSICAIIFSLLLLIGIAVCAICDMAISKSFTWSLFPISSIIFAWLVFFPAIKFDKKGVTLMMIALSVFIVPFLLVLNHLLGDIDLFLPISVSMAVISIAFFWVIFALFKILKKRKIIASAISLLMIIPVDILINLSLSKMISGSFIDVWDIFGFSVVLIVAIVLFCIDFAVTKKQAE